MGGGCHWGIISVSEGCDCVCQTGAGCCAMAELVTDVLFPAALFPDAALPGWHWGGSQTASRLSADTVLGTSVSPRPSCHNFHSAVSLTACIDQLGKVVVVELCRCFFFMPSSVPMAFLLPLFFSLHPKWKNLFKVTIY